MTRRANARLAGLTFRLCIAVALPANTLFALCCRAGEGLVIAIFVVPTVALLWLATAGVGVRDAPTTGRSLSSC